MPKHQLNVRRQNRRATMDAYRDTIGAATAPCLAILIALMISPVAGAQTFVLGGSKTQFYGDVAINPNTAIYTRIFVVNPPQADNAPSSDNTNFKAAVMTQHAIDGVVFQVLWNFIETAAPTTTDCTANAPDVCQPDPIATGWFHVYNWTNFDDSGSSTPCTDTTAKVPAQWFCDFSVAQDGTGFKQVAFQLIGVSQDPDADTPPYITDMSSSWTAAVTAITGDSQDVVNSINASSCGSAYKGSLSLSNSQSFQGDMAHSQVIVNWTTPPFLVNDIVWVHGVDGGVNTGFDVTGRFGARVTAVGPFGFNYAASPSTNNTIPGASTQTIIKAVDSWPVPNRGPYKAGWEAFLKAAIYHFNHINLTNNGRMETTSQIAYIRPGVARGGEALPICTTSSPMSGFTEGNWTAWYTNVADTVQAANPVMQIMYSINGDTSAVDATFSTAEAGIAVAHQSASGAYSGFGSQGFQYSDVQNFNSSMCPNTGVPNTSNNWGCMFTEYWLGGSSAVNAPLELQQIDCSNPKGSTYLPSGTNNCFLGTAPSAGDTLDLRNDYPFATANHASIIEIYKHDALLAFDPNYCIISGGSCTTASDNFSNDLSSTTQLDFFNAVGIDHTCYSRYGVSDPGTTGGACQYAAALYAAHGYH